jgi:hypothetical protein
LQWTLLSGLDTAWQEFQQYSNIYPGPDDKLYIGNWDGLGGQMSVINYPDSNGTASGFCRKCLRFPGYIDQGITRFAGVSMPPCMPNYELGPTNPMCYPAGVTTPSIEKALFMLFPNPSDGVIEITSNESGIMQLYDMTGRLVNSTKLSTNTKIDVGFLPSGVYQYRFTGKSNRSKTGKLVIKR